MPKDFEFRDMREKNIKIKALEVVQGLALLYEESQKTHELAERIIQEMFKTAHVSLGNCQGNHEKWLDRLNRFHDQFKGIYFKDD